jgi:pimeloyl-ACP methyl ester carboxylesterase
VARLSRQTREIIKTVVVVVIIALLLFFYTIYPLNRVKAMWGRTGIDSFKVDPKNLPANDPGAFVAADLTADSFRVESDGATSLAGLFLRTDKASPPRGTIVLIHAEREDRTALVGLAGQLLDSGFNVVVYDQRASGLSTAKYHGDGQVEAGDLEAVIGHLGVHQQLVPPMVAVGWKLGADAALAAAQDEKRINGVVAIEPYLTSHRMVDALKEQYGAFWFPLYRSTIWFWFNIRSGYGAPYRDLKDIQPAACRTLLMVAETDRASSEVQAVVRLSGDTISVVPFTSEQTKLGEQIVGLAAGLAEKRK